MQASSNTSYIALIPAAGVGSRMGSQIPKQYLDIHGKSVIAHTVQSFLSCPQISHTYVVVSAEDAHVDRFLAPQERLTVLRCGGETRAETVKNGLDFLLGKKLAGDRDWILVHDAARPGLTGQLIQHLIEQIKDDDIGGLLALPVVDTVKRVAEGKLQTISREGMWLAQTPQMFRAKTLLDALIHAPMVTDEASAIEFIGGNPKLVEGHAHNRKLTLPDDIEYLQMVLRARLN